MNNTFLLFYSLKNYLGTTGFFSCAVRSFVDRRPTRLLVTFLVLIKTGNHAQKAAGIQGTQALWQGLNFNILKLVCQHFGQAITFFFSSFSKCSLITASTKSVASSPIESAVASSKLSAGHSPNSHKVKMKCRKRKDFLKMHTLRAQSRKIEGDSARRVKNAMLMIQTLTTKDCKLPACRRLPFPLCSACNKGNRRRLHAGKTAKDRKRICRKTKDL